MSRERAADLTEIRVHHRAITRREKLPPPVNKQLRKHALINRETIRDLPKLETIRDRPLVTNGTRPLMKIRGRLLVKIKNRPQMINRDRPLVVITDHLISRRGIITVEINRLLVLLNKLPRKLLNKCLTAN